MIELTVKTLDSRNHAFSVEDETTVQQLKAKIEETMSIPAASQRLIYCGRVMQDEKKLSEYDVNGKVIHLVKSQPPQPGRRPTGTGASSSSDNANNNTRTRRPRIEGNAMFGSVVIPMESGLLVQGVQGSHQNRAWRLISNAELMIQLANEVIDHIENPNATPSTSTSAVPSTTTTPYNSSRDSSGSHSPTIEPQQPGRISLNSEARTSSIPATTAPAVDTDMEAEGGTGPPHITVSNADPSPATTSTSASSSSTATTAQETTNHNDPNRRQLREGSNPNNLAILLEKLRSLHNRLSPLLNRYHHILCEDPPLNPDNHQVTVERQNIASSVPEVLHLLSHAYHAISELSVDMESAPPRLVRASTPPLHQLVQQFSMAPGQTVTAHIPGGAWGRSRAPGATATPPPSSSTPVGSASAPSSAAAPSGATYMTTTFPAEGGEATTTITTRPTADAASPSSATTSSSSSSTPIASTRSPMGTATAIAVDGSAHAFPGIGAALSAAVNLAQAQAAQVQALAQAQAQALSQAPAQAPNPAQTEGQPTETGQAPSGQQTGPVRGSSIVTVPVGMIDIPTNVEFFMEVVPSTVTIDSVEATVVTSGSFTAGTASEGNSMGINFPWGGPPPQEFLESVMQAFGHIISNPPTMRRRGSAPESSAAAAPSTTATTNTSAPSSSTSASATSSNAPSPSGAGQNSQARGYTATNPTTSTQTRSTPRPHVHHIAATPLPAFRTIVDPFLPCQSPFFMRQHRRRPNASAQTSQPATTPAPSTTSSTGPSPSAPASTPAPAPALSPVSSTPPQPSEGAAAPRTPAPAGQQLYSAAIFNAIPPSMAQTSLYSFAQSMRSSPSVVEALTNLLSPFAGASLGISPEVPVVGVGSTVDDEEQEGQSLLTDLRLAVVRSITVSDLVALSMSQWATLNHIRSDLRRFVMERVLEGESASEERVERGVNMILNELRPHLDIILEGRLRDDIDAVATLNRFHESVIPEFLQLVLDDDRAPNFGSNIYEMVKRYLLRLWSIVKYCCVDGEEGVQTIIQSCINRLPNNIGTSLTMLTAHSLAAQLRVFTNSVHVPLSEIQQFIVYRTPSNNTNAATTVVTDTPSTEANPEVSSPSPSSSAAEATFVTDCVVAVGSSPASNEPMETDPQSPPLATTSAASTSSVNAPSGDVMSISSEEAATAKTVAASSQTLAMDTDVPPVPPPEAWHRILPAEWVPIIARDQARQRRPNTRAPLSDAYLSGMPAKRRKVVTANKPQGTLSQVISANMGQAIQSSGVSTVRVARIQEEAGSDQRLLEAYREQLRASVRANLANNPDFSAERFPNAARYFGKS